MTSNVIKWQWVILIWNFCNVIVAINGILDNYEYFWCDTTHCTFSALHVNSAFRLFVVDKSSTGLSGWV